MCKRMRVDFFKSTVNSLSLELKKLTYSRSGYTIYFQETVNKTVENYKELLSNIRDDCENNLPFLMRIEYEEIIDNELKTFENFSSLKNGRPLRGGNRNLNEYEKLKPIVDKAMQIVSTFNKNWQEYKEEATNDFYGKVESEFSFFYSNLEKTI